ncbi:ABC transporter permease subunit [Romboutsia sedimentorum]|uniref:ABC transporter permease subunit n=1 Tax=Romboutsia sedimentorum TaxID=1368474 RepID=UPI0024DE4141|nr:ABC transporter permease subunit [Romboutsia sedimentorum]MDK2587348.1 ABC transporter permease subunit [Romboutsia sedimentorum]
MINIFKVEFKRMGKSKSNIIIFGISIMITIILAFFCIYSQVSETVLPDGSYKILKGLSAIKVDTGRQSKMQGDVTSEKLIEALSKYKELHNKYGDNVPSDIDIKEVGPYKEFLTKILPYSFSDLVNRVDNQEILDLQHLTSKEAGTFYEQRNKNQNDNFKKRLELSDSAQKYAENMDNKVKKPFYFSPFIGWDTALEFLGIIMVFVAFMGCILVTPVFSSEYESGADDIMRCTKYGRKHLAIAKLIVANLIVLFLYIICMSIFYGITYITLNTEGLNTSIQFIQAISPVALTFGKAIFIIMTIGLITVLSIVNFTLFLSTRSKSSIFISSISTIMIIFPMLTRFIIHNNYKNGSNIIKFLIAILPSGGIKIYDDLIREFNLFYIGDWVIWSPYVIVTSSILMLICFFLLSVYSYSKHESR